MLAEQNEYIQAAANTIYTLTQEEEIRLQCEAREDYYRRERYNQHRMKCAEEQLTITQEQLAISNAENADLRDRIAQQTTELAAKDALIAQLKAALQEQQ